MDTRERLIESTRELLWDRGYVGTSPKAIQQRSCAGQGSMYHHFQGKQELALAAIERNTADLVNQADAELMADPDLRRPVEDAFAAVRDRLTRVLDEGRRSGELDPAVDPAVTAT